MPVEQMIFTDLPRGRGVDPAAAGYQVKACSPGLDAAARQLLGAVCLHYGEAVYRAAPPDALDRETAWRSQAADVSRVPAEVLAAFPVIWSYDRLADDRYALTRVCYRGLTHDGRFGNFFAHSLVFPPDALAACGSNPLALRRSRLFRDDDPGDATELPALPDLGPPAADADPFAPLRDSPVRDHLPALAAAVAAATPARRPVLLALPDPRDAERVAEALLALLPPSARRRTTVCTYETDRTWVPAAAGAAGRPAAAHHLLVLAAADGGPPALRADEYQSAYAAFNFAANQFSPLGPPPPYPAFAAECVLSGRGELVGKHHETAERLGVGADPRAWDLLADAARMADPAGGPGAVVAAAAALAQVAARPEQAAVALGLLSPAVLRLADGGDADALARLAPAVAALADRAPADAREFVGRLQNWAQAALGRGAARTAAALVAACGAARPAVRAAVLGADRVTAPADPADAAVLFDLAAEELAAGPVAPEPVVLLAFDAAAAAGRPADAWAKLADRFVRPRLAAPWDAATDAFVRRLQAALPPDRCPEPAAELCTARLDGQKPKGDDLLAGLSDLLRAGAGCPAPVGDKLVDRVVKAARDHFKGPDLAIALGRLADAAHGTRVWDRLFAAYREDAPDKHKPLGEVRRKLAGVGAARLLGEDLLHEVRVWADDTSPDAVKRWRDDVAGCPAAADWVCSRVAERLKGDPDGGAFELARHLLTGAAKGKPGAGAAALWREAVLALPLGPVPDEWEPVLAAAPADPGDAAARVGLLRLLRDLGRRAAAADWSPAAFPADRPEWAAALRALPAAEREEAVGFCVGTFRRAGVTTRADAEGLLRAVGGPDPGGDLLAPAILRLVEGRDPVTTVVAVTAVFDAGAANPSQAEVWAAAVGAVMHSLGRPTRRLFTDHLDLRFGRREGDAAKPEDRFRERVGLPRRAGAAPAVDAAGKDTAGGTPAAPAATGGVAKRLLGWVWGKPGK